MKKIFIFALLVMFLFTAFTITDGIKASETGNSTDISPASESTIDEGSNDGTVEEEESANGDSQEEGGDTQEESVDVQGETSANGAEDSLFIKTSRVSSSDDVMKVSGGITLIKGDVEINAEEGLYYEDENRAELEGDIVLVHDEGQIKSKTLEAWINEDRYIFEDDVDMIQNLDDGEFSLLSPYLELMKEDNSFKANKGVVIEYNGRTLKGDEVLYNDQEETLELISNVYIEEEDGDWVRSKRAVFYLKTEEFSAEGDVELEIDISSD